MNIYEHCPLSVTEAFLIYQYIICINYIYIYVYMYVYIFLFHLLQIFNIQNIWKILNILNMLNICIIVSYDLIFNCNIIRKHTYPKAMFFLYNFFIKNIVSPPKAIGALPASNPLLFLWICCIYSLYWIYAMYWLYSIFQYIEYVENGIPWMYSIF